MNTINAEVSAQHLFVPSSNRHTHRHQAAASGTNVIEVQSVHRIHPWNPAVSKLGYWTKQPVHPSALTLHDQPELEIHFCHTSVQHAITRVAGKPSSAHVTAAPCEPDSTSATFGNTVPESITATTTMADVPVAPARPTLRRESNLFLIALLEQAGYLLQTAASADNTMFASELIVAVVRFASSKVTEDAEPEKMLLAKNILRDKNCYGGLDDEAITQDYARQILHCWMIHTLFNASVDDLIVQHLTTSAAPCVVTTQDLADWLRAATLMVLQQGVVDRHINHSILKQAECWIWNNIYPYVAPLLIYVEHHSDLTFTPTDPQWGLMHAGFLFAIQSGFDIHTISKELALEAGKLLMRSLKESDCAFSVSDYFHLPIRCHQVLTCHLQGWPPPLDTAGESAALRNYLTAANQVAWSHQWIGPLREVLKNYQTRFQSALEIARTRRTDIDLNDLLDTSGGLLLNIAQLTYGNPSEQFHAQFQDMLHAFGSLDNALIAEAFHRLDAEEIHFISHASIQFAYGDISIIKGEMAPSTSLPPLLPVLRMVLHPNPIETEDFFLDLIEGMDIFVASTPEEQRVYVFEIHNTRYDLKRIVTSYDSKRLVRDSTIKMISKQQTLHTVKLSDPIFQQATGNNKLHLLMNNIGAQHQYRFYLHLHFRGMNHRQPDTIECITASFGTFYNCLDKNVRNYLFTSQRIGNTPFSNGQSQAPSADFPEISIMRVESTGQTYPITRLVGKQHEGKDIYVQINPRTGMLFGYKLTLSPDNFLEPVRSDLAPTMSRADQENTMANVAPESRIGNKNHTSRQNVTNHARAKQTTLTRSSRTAFPGNAEVNANQPQRSSPARTAAPVSDRHSHSNMPAHLLRWQTLLAVPHYRPQNPDSASGIEQTTNAPAQECHASSAQHTVASSSGRGRSLEASHSGLKTKSDTTQLPAKKRFSRIRTDSSDSSDQASTEMHVASTQNQ
jgi:hypothetical protein